LFPPPCNIVAAAPPRRARDRAGNIISLRGGIKRKKGAGKFRRPLIRMIADLTQLTTSF
jgi:hypothetical protein